ncbi:MAG: TolC family protein [Acidobacteriota bacterium]
MKSAARTVLVSIALAPAIWSQGVPPPQAAPNGPAPVIQQGVAVTEGAVAGSIPSGEATPEVLPLSLRDALQRGLRYNLGVLTSRDAADLASADRQRALSALRPNVYAGITQHSLQSDLVAFGLNVPFIPAVVGPFGYQDARAFVQQTIYDRPSLRNLKSAAESVKAARLSADQARDLVVQAVSNAYLSVITDAARVEAIQAEVNTAQALLDRATDQKRAGTVAGIDVLRADVQFRTEEQRLLAQKNQVEKGKLALARAIGLPLGQKFTPTDVLPFTPLQRTLEDLLKQAYEHRPDYRAAQTQVRAAEFALGSARAGHWPSVVVEGDYGDIGRTFAASHGTYTLVAGVRIPIYAGGRIQTDIVQAETVLRNRKTAVEDLRGRIDYEVRAALLDLQSAADQVAVARGNADLANQTLLQARDRFGAGVTDNIEVVQAQQLLASANDNYISSLNAHNAAKIALATALGVAEDGVPQFLNLQPLNPAR